MTDRFSLLQLPELLKIILNQIDRNDFVFGISKDLFFNPKSHKQIQMMRFGELLESPIGVAAGPQTQLAQNIVASWLTGARFIELKTIQTLDELEVSKPCIDMQDEGYNCEWSQELKIEQSFDQYLNAWIIIHILRDKFGWNTESAPGVIFNMSVGYNYEGILQNNIQWFFDKMHDASSELTAKIESIIHIYPNITNLKICATISDNITLSTMHGCPSDEIEKIGEYLLIEKNLHTTIKLNPTLLGKEKLNEILKNSGFETVVPNIAFEHDLKYDEALRIIRNLQAKAKKLDLQFGVKLTNTLESLNNKDIFSSDEKMMYMSGRALHPISINLASKLQTDFEGMLDISFSGGADAFNIVDIVSCGLAPVTVCTDLLKPGGYGKLHQYISELVKDSNLIKYRSSNLENLQKYADSIKQNTAYNKNSFHDISIKTDRKLRKFDCIAAPCVATCPTNQGIPDYMYYTSIGEFKKAANIIQQTNPFPHTTGMVCDHICQTKCTRINYDSPVLIREIKRFVSENANPKIENKLAQNLQKTAAIIGAGPSGLSCAYFLALAGIKVIVYETKENSGGMVSDAIPLFRLTDEAIKLDLEKIIKAGVRINYSSRVDYDAFSRIKNENDFIYIGTGAQISKPLMIDGIDSMGVVDPIDFLFRVKKKEPIDIGTNVVIIGGGNTAMDTARTAYRCVGKNGKVTIVYRRTIKQMPADTGEIRAVIDEGIEIIELVSPLIVNSKNNKVVSLSCRRMELGEKDKSGRERPIEILGGDFELEADTIIPAIGQSLDIYFIDEGLLKTAAGSYQTQIPNVYIGGDAMRGASTAINAIGDGRKAAQEIIYKAGIDFKTITHNPRINQDYKQLMNKRAFRISSQKVIETDLNNRRNFNLVNTTLSKDQAIAEASRCLLCDEVCDICTTVCPNLAFHSFEIKPFKYKLPKVIIADGKTKIAKGDGFEIEQKHQIIHIADWCNECGNCTTFCPTNGAPYKDKPHLYLTQLEFHNNKDGYYMDYSDNYPTLLAYQNEDLIKYYCRNDFIYYESDRILIEMDNNTFEIKNIEIREKVNFELDLSVVAQLNTILKGALSFYNL